MIFFLQRIFFHRLRIWYLALSYSGEDARYVLFDSPSDTLLSSISADIYNQTSITYRYSRSYFFFFFTDKYFVIAVILFSGGFAAALHLIDKRLLYKLIAEETLSRDANMVVASTNDPCCCVRAGI